MIPEIGHFALILAFVVTALQAVIPLIAAHRGQLMGMVFADRAAVVQLGLVAISFACLTLAYIGSDFSVLNVYDNSHTLKPMIYKISGVWGNHEGSMLLWLLMLAFLGAMVAIFGQTLRLSLRARILGVQAVVTLGFLAFSLFTSNPFLRISPTPPDGTDLNPLLQDPGLAFHPPFLYFGYVGMSIAFAFAVAALLEGKVDAVWARWVRPWTLLAWSSLTLGIAMGAWWAYYELGWGGYWFWDPVENASLMPWLAATALLHCAIVVEKRDTLKLWTILMAIVAFSTSLLGTFIVRSGLLTSVHAFANDPARGVLLLALCVVLTGAALLIFALRGQAVRGGGTFALVSRESALVLNNVFLSVILFVVLLGTFWPIFGELESGQRISVGPPYYTIVTTPIMALLAVAMGAGILLPWRRGESKLLVQRLILTGVVTALAMLVSLYLSGFRNVLAAVGLGIALWIILSSITDVALRMKLFRTGLKTAMDRAAGFPRSYWGGALAHIGVGVAILGMVGTSLWLTEKRVEFTPGETVELAGYQIRYDAIREAQVDNYLTEISTFSVLRNGEKVATIEPERRYYPVADQTTTEADFVPRWASDVYIAVGERIGPEGQGREVRLYYHPLVYYIWSGAIFMALGGLLSLSDRRYRLGVAARRTRSPASAKDEPAGRARERPA